MKSIFTRLNLFLIILVFSMGSAFGQSTKVSGTVTDINGEPLIGATISILEKHVGVVADFDGKFEIMAEIGDILQCSYIGYESMSLEVSGETVNFQLEDDLLNLSEVIVTGSSGLTTKKQLGSSIVSVNTDDLSNGGGTSITEALQGRIAGAQIMKNSGGAASSISIRLRGASTILGSSDPLILIDGVIVNGDARSTVSLGSYRQNPLSDIDMNDIERIEVLKGAAAAARYGSLAGNGIIHIITKKGKMGKPKITFSTSMNFNSVLKTKPYNDVNLKWIPDPNNPDNFVTEEVERYNYQDYIFDKTTGKENFINISGGTDKTKYSFSASLLDNDGILRNTNFNRKTFKVRLDQTLTDWLTISVGNFTSFNKSIEIPFANAWTGNPMVSLLFADNSVDGAANDLKEYANLGWMSNPYEDIDLLDIYQKNTRNISDIQLKAFLLDGLSINYSLGYDYTNSNGKFKIPYGFTRDSEGNLSKFSNVYSILNSNFDMSYSYGITGDVKGTTGLGYGYQKKEGESYSVATESIPEFDNIDVYSGDITGGNYIREISYWGGYLQQQFAYADKLFLTFAGRLDGSSTFGIEQRQQFYPKVSAAYSLSDEGFWENSLGKFFNSFKLRSAWGQAGNLTALDASPYGIYYNYGVGAYNGNSAYFPSSISGNEELRPERQSEFEIGADMSMLDSKIGLEFTYYKQDVYDLLLNRNLSPSTGYSSKFENIGNMTNNGIELALNAKIIDKKDFGWTMRGSYSRNRNLVTHVEGGRISLGGFGTSIAQTNQPLGVFYGYFAATDSEGNLIPGANDAPQNALGHYDHITLSDGEEITVAVQDYDNDGNPSGEKLKKIIGDPNPDYLASFTNEFKYKDFVFRIHFDAVQGFDVMSWDKRIAYKYPGGVFYGEELKGEKPKGFYGGQYGIYDQFIEDGSFIKLRELSLAYTLKLNKPYVKSIRFILSGSNLLTISKYWGYDPEVNFEGASNGARAQDFGNIPIPKVYKIGATVNF